ncbi:MAG: rhomboid family intramembrane serine protease, partial [Micromonosporaceae bacterium]
GGAESFVGALVSGQTPLHLHGSIIGLALSGDGGELLGVANGEYWRLFTSMFLHYGLLHLAVNMWALWILGQHLERILGPARFLTLYLLSGLGGSVAVYLFTEQNRPTAGASGAIFGLFAALFVVNRKLGLDNRGVIGLILINLSLGLFIPNISMTGHLGGLVIGGVVAFGLAYAPRSRRTAIQVVAATAVAVLLVALTVTRTGVLLS